MDVSRTVARWCHVPVVRTVVPVSAMESLPVVEYVACPLVEVRPRRTLRFAPTESRLIGQDAAGIVVAFTQHIMVSPLPAGAAWAVARP